MVTTSRVIVVLRSELGHQLKLANKYYADLQAETPTFPTEKEARALAQAEGRINRINRAQEALGALMLGDIEDSEHNFK